jgi:hypothetical protein
MPQTVTKPSVYEMAFKAICVCIGRNFIKCFFISVVKKKSIRCEFVHILRTHVCAYISVH